MGRLNFNQVNYFLIIMPIIISCKKVANNNLNYHADTFYSCFDSIKIENSIRKDYFKVCIDTTKKLIVYGKEYNKILISSYRDSLFISLKNDTIYTYEDDINFEDISFVLNTSLLKKPTRSRFGGYDYTSVMTEWEFNESTSDTLYYFSLHQNQSEYYKDVQYQEFKYPEKDIESIIISRKGIISVVPRFR